MLLSIKLQNQRLLNQANGFAHRNEYLDFSGLDVRDKNSTMFNIKDDEEGLWNLISKRESIIREGLRDV